MSITPLPAEAIWLNHPEARYAVFAWTDTGDLFLTSDYGIYSHSWPSFNGPFKKFLRECNAEYIVDKFENNYRNGCRKTMDKTHKQKVTLLVHELLNHLKNYGNVNPADQ